jgi:hypothetical protein
MTADELAVDRLQFWKRERVQRCVAKQLGRLVEHLEVDESLGDPVRVDDWILVPVLKRFEKPVEAERTPEEHLADP